jgi:hypothetical protein
MLTPKLKKMVFDYAQENVQSSKPPLVKPSLSPSSVSYMRKTKAMGPCNFVGMNKDSFFVLDASPPSLIFTSKQCRHVPEGDVFQYYMAIETDQGACRSYCAANGVGG